jgi:DNA-binding transcriptional LysR family regulator
LELRQLRYFIEVADQLHFRKASERLFISQSALSQQIHLLEEEIGVDLFDRTKRTKLRKVELTDAGSVFLKDARLIIQQSEEALQRLRASVKHDNELRVGFFKLALREWTVEIINRIADAKPRLQVKIQEFDTVEGVQDGLLQHDIDMGITLLPLKSDALAAKVYRHDDLSVIMSSHHVLAAQAVIRLDQLRHEKWVIINKPLHPFYAYLEGLCQKAGFSREANIAHEVSSHEMLCSLVSLGIGVAFMPSLFDLSREKEIVARKVLRTNHTSSHIEVEHAIVWRKRKMSRELQSALSVIAGD